MPVMKAQAASRVRQSAIVMDLSNLELEAEQIVARAGAEAERIVAEARATAEREGVQIREQAREAGQREGFAAGQEEGRKQGHDEAAAQVAQTLTELASRWSQTLDLLQQNMPAHMADAKTDVVRLALAIAERVTHEESLRNRQVTQATVEETLHLIGNARKVVLQVHPSEVALLETYLPVLAAKIRTIESVELVADEAVTPGGCQAQFGAGQVDARLETQIQRIAAELLAGE